jgi:hypothetical protein
MPHRFQAVGEKPVKPTVGPLEKQKNFFAGWHFGMGLAQFRGENSGFVSGALNKSYHGDG